MNAAIPNKNETQNYIVLAVIAATTAWAGNHGIDASTWSSIVTSFAPLVIAGAAGLYSIISNWNQKKVPETATALHIDGQAQPVGSTVSAAVVATAKVVGALLVGFLLLHSVSAFAQTKKLNLDPLGLNKGNPQIKLPGQATTPKVDPLALWHQIVAALPADLAYALALAKGVNSANSNLRAACYQALITANAQANGANLKDASGNPLSEPPPVSGTPPTGGNAISEFEKVVEAVDNLQPSSPVIVACLPAANAIGVDVMTFVNAIVTGTALKAIPVLGTLLP